MTASFTDVNFEDHRTVTTLGRYKINCVMPCCTKYTNGVPEGRIVQEHGKTSNAAGERKKRERQREEDNPRKSMQKKNEFLCLF